MSHAFAHRLVVGAVVCVCAIGSASCRRDDPPQPVAPPAPQTSGTISVQGLKGPVTVVRDQWGVPHISAATIDDLFFAQGFVQAQDRLFQMDLWKRAAQGRLAEVLGANFIQRDSMTRRIQFRGDYTVEWASYGSDAKTIADAFTRGVNAWVAIARGNVPEEFAVAGWLPEFWKPEDLLNRTDAFLASGNALDDLFRARMVAALGAQKVDELLPLPGGAKTVVDLGVDLSAVTFVVSDALRRLGTPPFFTTLTNPVSEAPRPSRASGDLDVATTSGGDDAGVSSPRAANPRPQGSRIGAGTAWAITSSHSATGKPMIAFSELSRFETPARRYLVHLTAPGIDVIGATSPWLPGVVIGHNKDVAWTFTPTDDDTQDIFVERVNPENAHQVARDGRWVDMAVDIERVSVLGRDKPVEYQRLYTPNGVVIAQDRERHLVYTLRWAGTEPGGAGELAALSLIRATSASEFRTALTHWKAPAGEFLFAGTDGSLARQKAGLIPIRADGRGSLPEAAWLSSRTWQGFRDASTTSVADSVTSGLFAGAGLQHPQLDTLRRLVESSQGLSPEQVQSFQHDLTSSRAVKLVSALRSIPDIPSNMVNARNVLTAWDGQMNGTEAATALYVSWEAAIRQRLAARLVKSELVDEFALRLDPLTTLEGPVSRGAGGDIGPWRDILLVDALSDAVGRAPTGPSGAVDPPILGSHVMLAHPLGVFAIGQARFDVGPYPLDGHSDTVLQTDGRRGTLFRLVMDLADWNGTIAVNAPGQSGSASSLHYDDQASKWAAGTGINLVFDQLPPSKEAIDTLILRPE
ncbi:MAG: penicillin acylase family protein [Vicinamibacterales bacterium]